MKEVVGEISYLRNIRCYSCTSLNAKKVLNDVKDYHWHKWMENMLYVQFTEGCSDSFEPDIALRSGAKSQECQGGMCMKMSLTHHNGTSKVWRGCIPKSQNQIKADCTKVSSNEGSMELCTCDGHLCNNTTKTKSISWLLKISIILYFFINFKFN
uniref:UPAR/Ly6 domain-containing protein qvr n=1 Tax=Strongyloides papillosus TaxID=174720 RepID=A0A0N5BH54_STREA